MAQPIRNPGLEPRFPVPPLACDCHFHVFGPPDRHPWPPHLAVAFPDATLAGHLAMQARTGLERMVFVQPSHYGTDNRCLLDALAAAGDRARGVVTVAPEVADAELDSMHALGVRGMRVNAGTGETDGLPGVLATVEALAPRFAARGWHFQFIVHGRLRDALLPRLADLPVPVVIDHMGLFRVERAADSPGFGALLRLLEGGRCWVKLSGANRITRAGAVEAALPVMRALIEARPDRMVWGSDWPHTDARVPPATDGTPVVLPYLDVDENRLLAVLADACPDEATFRRILADNPARLYDFD